MFKAIIFDFGGVILKHKTTIIEDILLQMFPDLYDSAEKIWEEYSPLLNKGDKTSDDFIHALKRNINTEFSVEELKHKWKEFYKKEANNIDWGLLDFVEKLKKRYKVYLFTDTIDIHDEYNKTRNIYEKFHKVYKSFEEGVAKIEGKDAYLYILKKIKAEPNECIFIDDNEQNIKYAESVGMIGILYKNLPQLQRELKLQNIVV